MAEQEFDFGLLEEMMEDMAKEQQMVDEVVAKAKGSNRNLLRACHKGDLDMVKKILVDYNYSNKIEPGVKRIQTKMSSKKSRSKTELDLDINILNGKPLMLACQFSHSDVAKYLLEKGANPHASNNLALRKAVENDDIDLIKLLVRSYGARANNNDALSLACFRGKTMAIRILVEEAGADIYQYDSKPLMEACRMGNQSAVEVLFEHDMKFEQTNGAGLMIAIENGHKGVVKFLLNQNLDNDKYQSNALILAEKCEVEGMLELVQLWGK